MFHAVLNTKTQLSKALFLGTCSIVALTAARADEVQPAPIQVAQAQTAAATEDRSNSIAIGEILVTARGFAADLAPSKSSLQTTQPQSIINRQFIEDAVAQTTDLFAIALISPSTSGYGKNGPGLAESKTVLRGFQDGEFNVTFDGIPFGDTNNPTHHTTAYFPSSTIGSVVVDRGPGNAGQLGQATFGGSINLFSMPLVDDFSGSQSMTVGSFNTYNFVTTGQTGTIQALNGARVMASLQEQDSSGYLTNSGFRSGNQTLKFQVPVTDNVRLTFFGTHNTDRYYQADSDGATLTQVAAFGKHFALSNDPLSPSYYQYNVTHKETDFEYIRLQADLAEGFYIDNNAYSYFYQNDTLSALDVTGATPNGTKAGPAGNKNVPGYSKNNEYRVWGDIFRVGKKFSFGELRTGIWWETASTKRYRLDYDFTLAPPGSAVMIPDPREKTAPLNIAYLQHSNWDQYQPFADFEWHPLNGLTVTPGVKYVNFKRSTNALVQQSSRVPASNEGTFEKTLPYATVNYLMQENWSAYFQYAKGFLVPELSVFQVVKPNVKALAPQTSTNYQVGTVFNAEHFSFDGDLYYIDFNNKVTSSVVAGETVFSNIGGAVYKGIEAQGTYAPMEGLAVFLNGSLNSAKKSTDGLQIAKAPKWTAGGGVFYKVNGVGLSLVDKVTGVQWASDGQPAAYRIKPYNNTDFTAFYDFTNLRLQAGVYNLFDSKNVTQVNPNSKGVAFDQYFFQAGRSYQLTVKASF